MKRFIQEALEHREDTKIVSDLKLVYDTLFHKDEVYIMILAINILLHPAIMNRRAILIFIFESRVV